MSADNDDLLVTNRFISDINTSGGYGMTSVIQNHKLREHVESKQLTLVDVDENEELLDNDILKTNPVITEDGQKKKLDVGRRVEEKRTVININSIQRQQVDRSITLERNSQTGLYTREIIDDNGDRQIQLYTATILNNEHVAEPGGIQRPYYVTTNGNIGKLEYMYSNPNSYEIQLPRKFTNIKSIRLLSVEVPNTLNLVNEYNNVILVSIKDTATDSLITLKTGASPFSFILFQLTPGSYTLQSLAEHMEKTVNDKVEELSLEGYVNMFTITANDTTGKFSIKINNPSGRSFSFHWRFLVAHNLDPEEDELAVTLFGNLWYLLGFLSSYDVDSNGNDLYTTERTNLEDFGMNPQLDGRAPDETAFHTVKPTRHPDVLPNKYIYLAIKGLKTIHDIENPESTNFGNADLFAKIIFDVPAGETTHSFITNPKLFPDTLPELDRLIISWKDYAGLPVDFNYRNHSFSLEIIEYTDILDNVNYNTRRGTIDETYYPDLIKYNS